MEPTCECDQPCCTWCDIHGDTGVVIDMEAHERAWVHYSVRDGVRVT